MRSRQEIEEQFKEITVPSDRNDLRISLELLLDIRESILGLKNLFELKEIRERTKLARQKVEEARRQTVENSSPEGTRK